MKPGNVDHDELEKGNSEPASIVERRNILKSGLATSIVFAGGTVLSVISCLREMFSPSDDTSESS
jgi:hypothetical protein